MFFSLKFPITMVALAPSIYHDLGLVAGLRITKADAGSRKEGNLDSEFEPGLQNDTPTLDSHNFNLLDLPDSQAILAALQHDPKSLARLASTDKYHVDLTKQSLESAAALYYRENVEKVWGKIEDDLKLYYAESEIDVVRLSALARRYHPLDTRSNSYFWQYNPSFPIFDCLKTCSIVSPVNPYFPNIAEKVTCDEFV